MVLIIPERQVRIMEMQSNEPIRTPTPRRRRRSKLQIFKEAYLPTIIMAVTAVLVLVFIIGGIVNSDTPQLENSDGSSLGSSSNEIPTSSTTEPPTSTVNPAQAQEAADLLNQAAKLAIDYDYAGAVAKLESFSGVKADFPELAAAIQQYRTADEALVSWNASEVYDLSFHVLIADPQRAFNDAVYKSSYKKNFITTTEFTNILNQLYDNGYILVDLDDFYTLEFNSTSGTYIYAEKQLRLPEGKKPVMLTELSASYYAYMQNGDQDGKADGFACRLAHDGNVFYNELINEDGSISTGAYDMVPLLEEFIAAHPDFSYRNARAVISFAGYDRILGYRINDSSLSADALQAERDGLKALADTLKATGYKLACYTYNNVNYTNMTAEKIQEDISKWAERVTPWLGEVDIIVFAREGDISDEAPYTGNSKFNVLYNAGFRFFLGVSSEPWNQVADRYVRHNRLMVTGSYLLNKPEQYAELFDVAAILDEARNP
jgi:hypothetical protein